MFRSPNSLFVCHSVKCLQPECENHVLNTLTEHTCSNIHDIESPFLMDTYPPQTWHALSSRLHYAKYICSLNVQPALNDYPPIGAHISDMVSTAHDGQIEHKFIKTCTTRRTVAYIFI